MEPREEDKRESQQAPEAPKAGLKLKRFRIVKLEERIAPLASRGGGSATHFCGYSIPTVGMVSCL